LQSIFTKVIG